MFFLFFFSKAFSTHVQGTFGHIICLCFAGLLLSLGGFLSFMVTGSISAIRFGVIIGGALLFLSVSSLRSYKQGESSPLTLKGQAG